MPIPKYDQTFLPILKILADNKPHNDLTNQIIQKFNLSNQEASRLLSSGKKTVINDRVGWGTVYLKKAGLVFYPSRGFAQITKQGLELLKTNPTQLTKQDLLKYPSFIEFINKNNREAEEKTSNSKEKNTDKQNLLKQNQNLFNLDSQTPDEQIDNYFNNQREELKQQIIEEVMKNSPYFFEKLVIDVLLKLGYGGTDREARTTLKSRDEGVDGLIKEDRLGLDIIYVQAKRWQGVIGRDEVHKFAGALQGQRAKKGVFITTSSFTKDALEYVKNIESKIVLIDGQKLAEYMIDYDIGVSQKDIYIIKGIDSDYFIEE